MVTFDFALKLLRVLFSFVSFVFVLFCFSPRTKDQPELDLRILLTFVSASRISVPSNRRNLKSCLRTVFFVLKCVGMCRSPHFL